MKREKKTIRFSKEEWNRIAMFSGNCSKFIRGVVNRELENIEKLQYIKNRFNLSDKEIEKIHNECIKLSNTTIHSYIYWAQQHYESLRAMEDENKKVCNKFIK